jgi:hypothetical protein
MFTDLELEGPFHVGKLGGVGVGVGECCCTCTALSQIFSRSGIFRGLFNQHIVNIAGGVRDAAKGGAESAQRPALRVNEP